VRLLIVRLCTGFDIDSNVVALGFILMVIVLIIAAWGWCVRRTKRGDELQASLVEENPGYVAPHEVLCAGGSPSDYAGTNTSTNTMGLHAMKMARSSTTQFSGGSGGGVDESQIDAAYPNAAANPFVIAAASGEPDSHV